MAFLVELLAGPSSLLLSGMVEKLSNSGGGVMVFSFAPCEMLARYMSQACGQKT
jgi:hypothetical protein